MVKSGRTEQEMQRCAVCFEQPARLAYTPCGHRCICPGCASTVVLCPICREGTNPICIFESGVAGNDEEALADTLLRPKRKVASVEKVVVGPKQWRHLRAQINQYLTERYQLTHSALVIELSSNYMDNRFLLDPNESYQPYRLDEEELERYFSMLKK